jgi:hypothetical protein
MFRKAVSRCVRPVVLGGLALALAAPSAMAAGGSVYGRVFRSTTPAQFADAGWRFRPSPTTEIIAYVSGLTWNSMELLTGPQERALTVHGPLWYFDLQIWDLDAEGNRTGGLDYQGLFWTYLDTWNGSMELDRLLRSAHVGGTALPTHACYFDANGFFTSCFETTVDVNVSWTGYGAIARGATTYHNRSYGFVTNFLIEGGFRLAIASGVVAGYALPGTTDPQDPSNWGVLGSEVTGEVRACITSCQ